MPNYVANILSFKGEPEKIKRMLSEIQSDEFGPGSFSFQKILPMPPELDIESGTRTERGLKAYHDFLEVYSLGRPLGAEELQKIPQKSEDAFLKQRTDIDRETWDLGKKAFQNTVHHGAPDWYDWRLKHWGVKWDAGGYDENTDYSQCDKLIFRTAWQEPAPVIQKLSEMYPDIEITHQWAEEQIGHYCGTAKYLAGVQTEYELMQ